MRQVHLQEDEAQFSALIAEAEAGESLTILRGDKPVAQIIPFRATASSEADRKAAAARLDALMEQGFDMGHVWNGRDELYDRD